MVDDLSAVSAYDDKLRVSAYADAARYLDALEATLAQREDHIRSLEAAKEAHR